MKMFGVPTADTLPRLSQMLSDSWRIGSCLAVSDCSSIVRAARRMPLVVSVVHLVERMSEYSLSQLQTVSTGANLASWYLYFSISFDLPSPKPKACINCKRRKIRCDGERPKCGPCSRSIGFQDCEYPEDGPTRTQILEEQITLLQARIEELEKPKNLRTTLSLHSPYAGERRSASLPALSWGGSSVHLPMAHSELSSRTSSPLSLPSEASHHHILSFLDLISRQETPLVELDALVHNFLRHSSQFGFFLNVDSFREAAMNQNGERPAAGLLDVVYLFAIHLSGSEEVSAHEVNYRSRALRTAADTLSGTHYNTVLHSIQAEGLHRIRSADPHATGGPLGPAFHSLAPPRDAIEECERINAFWTVLTLNNCWTTADGSPSNISYTVPDARIDTPWPLDINTSDVHTQALPDSSIGTVTTFLANLPDSGVSEAALHAKAGILFEQASRLASHYRPNILNNEQLNQFYLSFNSIDAVIEGFKLNIPTVQPHSTREMLVIHCLAHVATIQLHNPFVIDVDASRLRVLSSARTIVADLIQASVNEFVYINPIMGTLLMATCQVFITELVRVRPHRPLDSPSLPEKRTLMDAIETVLAVMNVFAPGCKLMDSQLVTMQQLYHAILD
ncbi:Fungal-trans domain-containing protein [Mycena venus]|uniref:Fungal-trans domain-containing protein n=1 Tax=Mycena venus TaxID=2733690 RepID=A0A8H7CEE4_9AGAR|nr:Fungal-trans domain-containing protein [Mycena venus]